MLKILGKIGLVSLRITEQALRVALLLMLLALSVWAVRCLYEFYTFVTNSDDTTWWAIYFPLPLGFISLYLNPLLTPVAFYTSYVGIKALVKDMRGKGSRLIK